MKMFEKELGIDEGIVVLSGHFLVGHVESVVGLGVIWIVFNGVAAGFDAGLMQFEFEVAEGEVGVGCVIIVMLILHVFQVAFDGLGDIPFLDLVISAFLQWHTTMVTYK